MKKYPIGVLGVMLLLASCSGSVKKGEADADSARFDIEFENYKYEAIAEMNQADSLGADGWKYCSVTGSGVFPKKIGNKDIKELRDSLERLAGIMFVSPGSVEARIDTTIMKPTELDPEKTQACSSKSNILTVELLTPEIVVWKDYVSAYQCAAAHGTYKSVFVNYRISDGKILSIADLMKPGYEEQLTTMIRKKLKEDGADIIVPLDQVQIPSDFRITSDGINFIYGIYDIAPYSAGEISVDFDAYELEELLAPGVLAMIYGN